MPLTPFQIDKITAVEEALKRVDSLITVDIEGVPPVTLTEAVQTDPMLKACYNLYIQEYNSTLESFFGSCIKGLYNQNRIVFSQFQNAIQAMPLRGYRPTGILSSINSLVHPIAMKQVEELIDAGWNFSLEYGNNAWLSNYPKDLPVDVSTWCADFTKQKADGLWDNYEPGYAHTPHEAIYIAYKNIKEGNRLK